MREADREKEVWRGSKGVSKGKGRREGWEQPSRGRALAPGLSPDSCPRCVSTASCSALPETTVELAGAVPTQGVRTYRLSQLS